MPFIFIEGWIDVGAYETLAVGRKCVFIFPGNSSHHSEDVTLFSIKGGAGLALAAYDIGSKGYPTLSLPTTSMEFWSTDLWQQNIVKRAISDLYRAFGAGFELMLPVREHTNTTYFDAPLAITTANKKPFEPKFWDGVLTNPNKTLANHYITELDKLSYFMSLTPETRKSEVDSNQDNLFYQAYIQGQNMSPEDPWLKE